MNFKVGDLVRGVDYGRGRNDCAGIGCVLEVLAHGAGVARVLWAETSSAITHEWVDELALVPLANPHTDVAHLEKRRPTNGQRVLADWLIDRRKPRAARAVLVRKAKTKPLPVHVPRFHAGGVLSTAWAEGVRTALTQFSESSVRREWEELWRADIVEDIRQGRGNAIIQGNSSSGKTTHILTGLTEYANNVAASPRRPKRTWPRAREWWHR